MPESSWKENTKAYSVTVIILSWEQKVEVPSGYELEPYIPDLLMSNSGLLYLCFSGILLV
jgi:hypothetical protein